jgi:3-oxoacyl-[acyl-carrier-protein] synthase-3
MYFNEDGTPLGNPNDNIIHKFKGITGIEHRRYRRPIHIF